MTGRDEPYRSAASEVLQFAEAIPGMVREGERTIGERAAALLARFEERIAAAGAPAPTRPPARYALAVLIDQRARAARGLRMSAWTATAHVRLFDGRDMSPDRIRKFQETAAAGGDAFAPLAQFLEWVLGELDGARRHRARVSHAPAILFLSGVAGLVVALAGYAAFLDRRYHAGAYAAFIEDVATIPAASGTFDGTLAARLDALDAARARVHRAAAVAPLADLVVLPFWASDARADKVHRDEVRATLPEAIAEAIAHELASEGAGLPLYDTLRAWSVLSGETDWSPGYLAGWLEARDAVAPLARHVPYLGGPVLTLPPPDTELIAQARGFAAEVSESERAWLELQRSDEARALAAFEPETVVPGLEEVVVRRSGRPLGAGLDGLYTAAGWIHAREVGAGIAVQRARAVAPLILHDVPSMEQGAPDRVLEELQRETLARWTAWLNDLRVRPFSDRDSAIRISGSLAQRASPLDRLIRAVWVEVGGTDRTRPHALQLRIASTFGPMIQYAEQGRVSELSSLFSSLNVALGSIEFDEERGGERLMTVQDRARSVAALAAAPPVVAQIAEDVLAQTSAAHASLLGNPLTRRWQSQVYPLCHGTVTARYPFDEGPDAELSDFAALFGPGGVLPRFVAGEASRYLDTSDRPWRWKPEARLSGLTPESAAFLETASVIGGAFFGQAGIGAPLELAALAERGEATMRLGGAGVPVRASGAAERLAWPGPDPDAGAEVAFRQGAETSRVAEPGAWGLFRLLDRTPVRTRDEGARMLLDVRTDTGRLFMEMRFSEAVNPVSARRLLNGLVCPPVL